jgi:hypothetical protein
MAELTRLVQMFEAAEEASQDARTESERARDYYDGIQLTAEEMDALRARRQPPVIHNLIRPKIDGLCGLERQTRTDPHCLPRTYGDDESAQLATDALRYVADDQKLDIKRSQVFNHMLTEGYGGVEVVVEQGRAGIDPKIVPLAWDRIFFDPHSCQADFSDATYLGFVTWMDEAQAKAKYKGKDEIIDATIERPTSTATATYEDKPRWAPWYDSKRKRLRIVTIYELEGDEWYRGVFTLAGELEECKPSPFLDEDGKPECALILASAFVDRENNRYGLVRDMFSLQDEVNKRRSKLLHLGNTRQARIGRSMEEDKATIRKELARPDGVIVADADELEILDTQQLSMAHANLLADAKDAMSRTGPNAHMQGKDGESQSGRAILAMQQAGMTEMAPLLDALRDFNMRVYRACWNRIRQFWTGERWIRVTDDEKAVKFFAVNTTQATVAALKVKEAAESGKIDQPTAQQYMMQIQQSPEMQQPANTLAELDVDIQIDEVMNTPTLHAEQFEQLVQLASSGMMQIPPEIIIRASSLRDKQQLLDLLEEAKEQQGQMGQQQQEMAQRGMEAEIAGKEADAGLKQAKAQETATKTALLVPQMQMDAMKAGFQQGAGQ